MSVYLSILNLGSSYAYPHDVASALHVALALPLEGPAVLAMSAENFEAVFTSAYKVLHYLLVKHEEIAADRIPVLFQVKSLNTLLNFIFYSNELILALSEVAGEHLCTG